MFAYVPSTEIFLKVDNLQQIFLEVPETEIME